MRMGVFSQYNLPIATNLKMPERKNKLNKLNSVCMCESIYVLCVWPLLLKSTPSIIITTNTVHELLSFAAWLLGLQIY